MVTIENELIKELTKAVENYKDRIHNEHKDRIIKDYGWFPDEFILNENDIINKFVNLPVKQYIDIFLASSFTIQYISNTDIKPKSSILKIYSIEKLEELYIWNNPLINKIKKAEVEKLNNELELNGELGLSLGYNILHVLSERSVYYHLNKNPQNYDALIVRYSDELEKYPSPDGKNYIEESINKLTRYVKNIYKKDSGRDNLDRQEIYPYLAESLMKAFPGELDVIENISRAASAENKITFIPNAIAKKLISVKKKEHEYIEKEGRYSLDKPLSQQSEDTFVDMVEGEFDKDEFFDLLSDMELIDELNEWDAFDNLTDRQKQVLSLIYQQDYSLSEAGKELGISKQSVDEILKAALKKFRKILLKKS